MAHGRPDELAKAREVSRLRKLGEREMRKPPAAWFLEGWNERPFRPVQEAADYFGVDKSTVTRWQAWTVHQEALAKQERESPRPEGLPESHFDWTEAHIPLLIDGFLEFREKYFRTERGRPFESPGFQQGWARGILTAKITGGNEAILAPVRHGKSKLLTHFCIYLICLDPNIRILWLGVTQDLAEGPLKQMRGIFESNEQLIEDYAGPEGTFQPAYRSLHKWTDKEFTVTTRTNMEIPGSNVKALGRGGTVIGKDADIIILDDIEDQAAVSQKGTRDKTKEWWGSDVAGRVEEHTGLFVIGSRQHHDDIYSLILREPEWNITVERAHDPTCSIEEDGKHWDCLLFPEVRSYAWLMKQKARLSAQAGGVALWERIYQNVERVAGLVVFSEEDVKACRSSQYRAQTMPGKQHDATGFTLVAGLDPAISGYQATILLAYQTQPELKAWLVDLDNTEGGGHAAVDRIVRRWHEKYAVKHWVIEENTFGKMSGDRTVQEYAARHGIYVQDWRTGLEKTNQFFGVTALSPLFTNKNFVLPYADDKYSRQITDTLVGQLLVWDESNSRNKNRTGFKDDLVMALWFAWQPIRRARLEFNAELGVDDSDALSGAMLDDWGVAPWGDWNLAS